MTFLSVFLSEFIRDIKLKQNKLILLSIKMEILTCWMN